MLLRLFSASRSCWLFSIPQPSLSSISELTYKPLWPTVQLYLPLNQKHFCSWNVQVKKLSFCKLYTRVNWKYLSIIQLYVCFHFHRFPCLICKSFQTGSPGLLVVHYLFPVVSSKTLLIASIHFYWNSWKYFYICFTPSVAGQALLYSAISFLVVTHPHACVKPFIVCPAFQTLHFEFLENVSTCNTNIFIRSNIN